MPVFGRMTKFYFMGKLVIDLCYGDIFIQELTFVYREIFLGAVMVSVGCLI